MIRAGRDFWAELSTGRWAVIVEDDQGFAIDSKAIYVRHSKVHTKNYADTCVHESIHASCPDLTEEEVVRITHDIVEVLWKRGYRLPVDKPKKTGKNT